MTDTVITPARSGTAQSRKGAPAARVFVGDQNSEGAIRQSLTILGVENVQYTEGNVDDAVAAFRKERSPRLLIVDVSGIHDPVASIRRLAEVCEPDVSVIVIGDRNDIVLYRDLKNTGISEYFLKPLVRDLLTRTCQGILNPRLDQPRFRTGKLIFVIGVRGGAGASTIAVNAAWHLAETRHRHTVLLDLDLEDGDAALQLDTTPASALRDAFEYPDRVDKLFLERGARHLSERLDLLASLAPLDEPAVPDEQAVLPLMQKLLVRYRFIVVDLPSPVARRLPRLLHLPSTCVLVSTASLASARDVARWREFLGPDTPERSTLHLLNQTATHGGLPEEDFAKGCGQAPDIFIPYDRDLATASVYGIKAMQKCAAFRRGLSQMLDLLTGDPVQQRNSIMARIFG